ncbi:MAG: ribonuclease P protein component [Bacteroidetes bacterium]|nr:ribonuclease P protein component [Bacteroidota bacterium]
MKQFGLSKKERIKSKTEFSLVYTKGSILFSSGKKLKANYYSIFSADNPGFKVAFGVHKKSGNAVWRNRIKRLLRTAVRLNKKNLSNVCVSQNKILFLVISPYGINQKKNKTVSLFDLQADVIELMNKICTNL